MTPSKRMMYDDLMLSPVLIAIGIFGLYDGQYFAGGVMLALGAIWFAIRLYHLTHQDEVFKE